MNEPYTYNAVVETIHDGDTIRVGVDLGINVWVHHFDVRLLGCNAAELGTIAGDAARDHLSTWLPPGTPVVVSTVKNDKFARYDAAITLPDGTDLVTQLVMQQWAAPWDGKGHKPTPPWPRTVP